MAINEISAAASPAAANATSAPSASSGLDKDAFLKLLMESMKNQDPFNPMENAEMMQQLSQLGQMEAVANLKMTVESMKSAMLGTQIQSGAALLNKEITALDPDGTLVQGEVDKVMVNNGLIELLIGSKRVQIGQVTEIQNEAI